MRRKIVTVCDVCGGAKPSGTADFVIFHCLTFCSPGCLDDYRVADEERRTRKEASRIAADAKGARSRAA
jgi:hypothetical protein